MGARKTAKLEADATHDKGCMVTAHREPAYSTRLAQVRCSVDEGRAGKNHQLTPLEEALTF